MSRSRKHLLRVVRIPDRDAAIAIGAGEDVRFKVSSDQAEEIHVHGYDLAQTVPAGGTVEFDFPADLEGIYEVELEELGVQIAELRVEP